VVLTFPCTNELKRADNAEVKIMIRPTSRVE
jgi:hypothetical protein